MYRRLRLESNKVCICIRICMVTLSLSSIVTFSYNMKNESCRYYETRIICILKRQEMWMNVFEKHFFSCSFQINMVQGFKFEISNYILVFYVCSSAEGFFPIWPFCLWMTLCLNCNLQILPSSNLAIFKSCHLFDISKPDLNPSSQGKEVL